MSDTPTVETVLIRRLSDREAPDGSWRAGQVDPVPVEVARVAIQNKLAELAPGATLPPVTPGASERAADAALEHASPRALETADLDGGETPESATRPPPRKRGGGS